jgi:hypothetical protein
MLVKCPTCGYVATWIPAKSDFSPALDMYTKCPEVTQRLNNNPEDRETLGGDPRHCSSMRAEWVRVMKETRRGT